MPAGEAVERLVWASRLERAVLGIFYRECMGYLRGFHTCEQTPALNGSCGGRRADEAMGRLVEADRLHRAYRMPVTQGMKGCMCDE